MKLIVLHHRLGGFSSHHYNEVLALITESGRRGWQLDVLISARTPAAITEALGGVARPVFYDPTFDFSRTFQERVDDFVSQLRTHAEPTLEPGSRVLSTVTTQCEACALARWAKTLPADRMPWFLVLFLSDRWNREDARPDEPAELETAAREFAALSPATRERFVLGATSQGLAAELSVRLRQTVSPLPSNMNFQGLEALANERRNKPVARPPAIALLGGSRAEKGSDRVPEIIAAGVRRTEARFIVQAHNEDLEPSVFEQLRALRSLPGVTLIEGAIDRANYESVLKEADALLFPYKRKNYKQRVSGLFAEGVAAGLPAIVPSGTWLAEQIESARAAGVVYDGDEPEAIERCVADIDSLTRTAATLAAPWRERESLGACLDAFEQLLAARAQ